MVGGDRGPGSWCSGSLWKTWWREATQSEAQGHQPIQEQLLVSPDPALRCSEPALPRKRAGGALQQGLCARFLCAESCPDGPPALGGMCELAPSLCSWHRAA